MSAVTVPKRKVQGKIGRYRVNHGTHCEGERICLTCEESFNPHVKEELEKHASYGETGRLVNKEGHEVGPLVIYGSEQAVEAAKAAEEKGDSIGVNGGNIVDSRSDLSKHNKPGYPAKFSWIGTGKYSPQSAEKDRFETMTQTELKKFAEDNEIDLEGATRKEDILVAIRQWDQFGG